MSVEKLYCQKTGQPIVTEDELKTMPQRYSAPTMKLTPCATESHYHIEIQYRQSGLTGTYPERTTNNEQGPSKFPPRNNQMNGILLGAS